MDRDVLYKLYVDDGLGILGVAKKLGCSTTKVSNHLKKYNIPRKPQYVSAPLIQHHFTNDIEYKQCSKCGEMKTLDKFYSHKYSSDGLLSWCRPCFYKKSRKYSTGDIGREKQREAQERYRATDSHHMAQKKWRESSKGRTCMQVKQHRRRALKANSEAPLTIKEWRAIIKEYHNSCAYCGSFGRMEMDHIIPLSKGGSHSMGNVVPACRSCNMSKRDNNLVEWLSKAVNKWTQQV